MTLFQLICGLSSLKVQGPDDLGHVWIVGDNEGLNLTATDARLADAALCWGQLRARLSR